MAKTVKKTKPKGKPKGIKTKNKSRKEKPKENRFDDALKFMREYDPKDKDNNMWNFDSADFLDNHCETVHEALTFMAVCMNLKDGEKE